MIVYKTCIIASSFALCALALAEEKATSGNPIFPGWYADPEGTVFSGSYWIYPTSSLTYDEQLQFDAFSSTDLVHWKKHESILDNKEVKWAKRAM